MYQGGFYAKHQKIAPRLAEDKAQQGNYAIDVRPEGISGFTTRRHQANISHHSRVIPDAINPKQASGFGSGEVAFVNLGTADRPRKIGDQGAAMGGKPLASTTVNALSDDSDVRPIGIAKVSVRGGKQSKDGVAVTVRGPAMALNTGADNILPFDYVGWVHQPTMVSTKKGPVPAVIKKGEESGKMRGTTFPIRFGNVTEQIQEAFRVAQKFKFVQGVTTQKDMAAFVSEHCVAVGPPTLNCRLLLALAIMGSDIDVMGIATDYVHSQFLQSAVKRGAIRPLSRSHKFIPAMARTWTVVEGLRELSKVEHAKRIIERSRAIFMLAMHVGVALSDELRSCAIGQCVSSAQPARYFTLSVGQKP